MKFFGTYGGLNMAPPSFIAIATALAASPKNQREMKGKKIFEALLRTPVIPWPDFYIIFSESCLMLLPIFNYP
jgi:hypothetical protein